MNRLLLSLLLLCLCADVIANATPRFEIRMEVKKVQQGIFWYFYGQTNLTNKSALTTCIIFGERDLPNSRRRIATQHGKFVFRYGPICKPVLAGEYVLDLHYNAKRQPAEQIRRQTALQSFSQQHKFFYGTPSQARQQQRDYNEFFRTTVAELQKLVSDLREQSEKFLQQKAPQGLEDMRRWLKETTANRQRIKTQIRDKFKNVLAPYGHVKSIKDLRSALASIDYIWKIRRLQLHLHYDLPLADDSEVRELKKARTFVVQYEKTCNRYLQNVRQREPLAKNISHLELERDLLWFNRIFERLVQLAVGKTQANWRTIFANLQQEMDDFALRIKEYQQSSLVQTYTDLVPKLRLMENNWRTLAKHYQRKLAGRTVSSSRERQLSKKLQRNFRNVWQITVREQKLLKQQKQEVWQQLHKALANFVELKRSLFHNLEKNYRIADSKRRAEVFIKWQRQWQPALQRLKQQLQNYRQQQQFQKYDEGVVQMLLRAVILPPIVCSEYIHALRQGQTDIFPYRSYHHNLRQSIRMIETRLKQIR